MDYAATGVTDIGGLSLRCGPHHQLITNNGWKTRKRHDGKTIPTTRTTTGPNRNTVQLRLLGCSL
ncbi:hypothetical protein [[Mycobacterium] vasticus]|uniref:hypothetical protein n=1 Tax=[Mycobacterium] vasticus TaxID=2875777 RepID=UPI0038B42970